ncbi:hypothetical protein [Arenicella xantha]|uniref:Uncharacterized protein n=1 Tax=Arenicella xantha TaxID=644221 RepID=A0A395JJN9_9GAMM|nr:hypothetical protein [Arenicella xantha]RBP50996.1 hypothetical protein DFR28_102413 [Arenicella xantha]
MKFNTKKEEIEYLRGKVAGLEQSIEDLVLLINSSRTNEPLPSSLSTVSTKSHTALSQRSKPKTSFDLERALSSVDVGHVIHVGTISTALEECWQVRSK